MVAHAQVNRTAPEPILPLASRYNGCVQPDGHAPLSIAEITQLPACRLQHFLVARLVDETGERRTLDFDSYKVVDGSKPRPTLAGQNTDACDAGCLAEFLQPHLIAIGEVALHHGRGAAAHIPAQDPREHCVALAVDDRCAHRHCQPTVRREHTPHLAEGCSPVWEEHQPKLAEDGVEGAVFKSKLSSIPVPPSDLRAQPLRDSQHALIEVKTSDSPRRPRTGCCLTCQDARSASDIEHTVARLDACNLGKNRRPATENRRHEIPLVGKSGIVRELPGIMIGHTRLAVRLLLPSSGIAHAHRLAPCTMAVSLRPTRTPKTSGGSDITLYFPVPFERYGARQLRASWRSRPMACPPS